MKNFSKNILVAVAVLSSNLALAITADEIMQAVDAFEKPKTQESTLTMVLVDGKGKQRVRAMSSTSKQFGDDQKSLMFFLQPSDIKGTGFLMFDYDGADKNDDQWMLLPSLNKAKRIASSDQTSSFMGSDFTYADMNERNIEEWNYKIIKEDEVNGDAVWLVESTPINQAVVEKYGYTKSVMYIKKDNFQIVRAINYTRKKGEMKLFNVVKTEKVNGYWLNLESHMMTRENGKIVHRTVMKIDDIKIDQALNNDDFTLNRLERGL